MITPKKSFWRTFKATNGALSVSEGLAIMNLAAMCPKGAYAEFGVYKGKSAMCAILGLEKGVFNLVEPEFADETFRQEAIFNITAGAGEEVVLNTIADYSTNVIPAVDGKFCYVMVDSGSHQDGLPMQEVKLLEDKMVKDGIIVFHDYQSQFSEVEQAYDYLVSTGKYEKVNIDWPLIIKYVDENNIEEGNNSWHHTELKNPCFVGAVKRK
jgi:hypothetical protein